MKTFDGQREKPNNQIHTEKASMMLFPLYLRGGGAGEERRRRKRGGNAPGDSVNIQLIRGSVSASSQ